MISLVEIYKEILREYGNQGPSNPEIYLITKNGEYKEVPISTLSKISNLIYDIGGGENSMHPEYNICVIDNMDIDEFIDNLENITKKIYIKYNLEKSYSFPKSDEIILSQVVYHINNIEALAKTVNDSLKTNGKIFFFSDIMHKQDKNFLKILIEKYRFYLPDNISFETLSKYKSKTLILTKNKSYITPKPKPKQEEKYLYKIKTKYGDALIEYTLDEYGYFDTKKISGNIPDKYFQHNRNSHEYSKETGEVSLIGTRFLKKKHDASKSPYPFFVDWYDIDHKNQRLGIISFQKVNT